MDHGESPSDLFPDIEVATYASLRRVWRQWRRRGVEPAALFDAAVNNPEALHDLVRRTGFDDYAQLLKEVAAGEPGANLEGLLCHWLNDVWECVRGHLQLDRLAASLPADFADRVDQMLDRLRRHLAKDPTRIPPRPPRPSRNEPPDIDGILDQPLL